MQPAVSHAERPALLTVEALASLCGCSRRTIYRLANSGQIPRPLKLGSRVRWRRDQVEQWIASNGGEMQGRAESPLPAA